MSYRVLALILLANLLWVATFSFAQQPPSWTLPAQENSLVPSPGPLTSVYRGHGIAFRYPSNWEPVEKQGRIEIAPPGSRRIAADGQEHFSHGVLVGFAQPSRNLTANDVMQELFSSYHKSNSTFGEVGQRRSVEVKGTSAVFAGWTDTDPYLGEEGGLLLVVKESHGYWWWLMVAPKADLEAYMPTFVGIAGHIDFEEPATQSAATFQQRESVDSDRMDLVQRIRERLKQGKFPIPAAFISIDASPKGAQSVNGTAYRSSNQIVLTLGAIRQLPEDELAFLIAHEFGHLMDMSGACENSVNHEKHECEDHADWIAEHIMVGSGYSGYAGAGLMGRWMMMGDRASFTGQLLITLFDTHRSEVGRTQNLLNAWRDYCTRFGC